MDHLPRQFAAFLMRLQPSPPELAAAREAAAGAVAVLRTHYRSPAAPGTADFLMAGSIGKRTATRPLPPADLLYILPTMTAKSGLPEDHFGVMAGVLGAPADGDWVATSGGAVRIRPAIERGSAFLIPVAGRWRVTNPAAEVAALRLVDRVSGGLAGRLLALLRAWRDTGRVPLHSFALENLVREFVAASPTGMTEVEALTEFFAWCRGFTPCRLDLPGGLDALEIDDAWHGAAEAAYWRCVLAARHAAAGDAEAATEEWRRVLGSGFPAARKAVAPPGTTART